MAKWAPEVKSSWDCLGEGRQGPQVWQWRQGAGAGAGRVCVCVELAG